MIKKNKNFSVKSEKYDLSILNKYFNKIYVINMDKDIDRYEKTKKILDKYNISFTRFSATDGNNKINEFSKIRSTPWNSWEKKQKKRRMMKNRFVYGCLDSHKRIIQDAKENNYKRILIFEDDIVPNKRLERMIKTKKFRKILNTKWRLMYFGSTQRTWRKNIIINKNIYYRARSTDSTFAYAIDRSIYDKILKLIKYPKFPIDLYYHSIQKRYFCPVLYPQLFISRIDKSNLRGGRNIRTFSKILRWKLNNFIL